MNLITKKSQGRQLLVNVDNYFVVSSSPESFTEYRSPLVSESISCCIQRLALLISYLIIN